MWTLRKKEMRDATKYGVPLVLKCTQSDGELGLLGRLYAFPASVREKRINLRFGRRTDDARELSPSSGFTTPRSAIAGGNASKATDKFLL
jgi:hypothetical protein